MTDMKKIHEKYGDGTPDPNLMMPVDPLFKNGFGSGVNRRDFLKGTGILAAAAAAAPFASFAQKKKFDPVVKIIYLPITDAAALLVAHEFGFFRKQGLKSDRPTRIRGWKPLVEAFAAKKFNLTHLLAPIPVAMRYNNKIPVKVTAWDHTNGSAIVVGKHTGIKTAKDLGGKQFAVPFWYSNHNIISQRVMRKAGINPVIRPRNAKIAANECNIQIMEPPIMPSALASKSIDAYCVAEPFCALGEIKAGGKILRFTGDIWKGHPCCVVAMHEEDTEDPERAAWTQAVHNAIIEAQIYISENRTEVAEVLSSDGKGKYYPPGKKVIERAIAFYDPAYYRNPHAIQHTEWEQDRINFQAWPYPSATRLNVNYLKDTELAQAADAAFLANLTADKVANDLISYRFVKKALEANPKWRKDSSVPQKGNPFNREEIFEV